MHLCYASLSYRGKFNDLEGKKHVVARPLAEKQIILDVSNSISLEWMEITIIFISHFYVDRKESDLVRC